jgi:cation diffusion facilitator CzcD-associated flavoprotein CzcO
MSAASSHVDVLIVGAGISGIGAACRLKERCPGKSVLILEARARIGGTWDLFRYPGIRSDSDMYTLGFPFRPWRGEKAIVEGEAIRSYVEETARAYDVSGAIRFGHKALSASWSSAEARWTVDAEADGEPRRFTCGFLYLASGYYDYDAGYRPDWPGEAEFAGKIVHPQHWPEGLDVAGKRIVIIGSGATAVTLAPALAEQGAQVVMLQRSPSYVVSRPSRDGLARRIGPRLTRWKNVLLGAWFFKRARTKPDKVRAAIRKLAVADLPPGYDIDRHFNPAYNPWDQRVCLIPDADLFKAIGRGEVDIVTDRITRFTKSGLALESGNSLKADIVVTATGLVVKLLGGMALAVDGKPIRIAEHLSYKGALLSDVPNLALSFGYTNASWTLKSDLTARYVCRLLNRMDAEGATVVTPVLGETTIERKPMLDFSSGYVQRAQDSMPKQGTQRPWKVHQNYPRDVLALRFGRLDDGVLRFSRLTPAPEGVT